MTRAGWRRSTGTGARTSRVLARSWVDDAFWFETGEGTRKGKNLARDSCGTLSVATHDFDLVVDGEARKVTDKATVAAMAERWAAGGWPARVDDTGLALTAEYSAPSAGPPPWFVYRLLTVKDGRLRSSPSTRVARHAGPSASRRGLGSRAPSRVRLRPAPDDADGRSVSTTRVARHLRAPRARVYRALLDPQAVQRWMVPDGMTSTVHSFEARAPGGEFRISLTYDLPTTKPARPTPATDTFHGVFARARARHEGGADHRVRDRRSGTAGADDDHLRARPMPATAPTWSAPTTACPPG